MDVVCGRYVYFITRWKGKRKTDMLHSCIAKKNSSLVSALCSSDTLGLCFLLVAALILHQITWNKMHIVVKGVYYKIGQLTFESGFSWNHYLRHTGTTCTIQTTLFSLSSTSAILLFVFEFWMCYCMKHIVKCIPYERYKS